MNRILLQVFGLFNDSWPLADWLCTFVAGLVRPLVGLGSSVFNLALIAFNRFTLITESRTYYALIYIYNWKFGGEEEREAGLERGKNEKATETLEWLCLANNSFDYFKVSFSWEDATLNHQSISEILKWSEENDDRILTKIKYSNGSLLRYLTWCSKLIQPNIHECVIWHPFQQELTFCLMLPWHPLHGRNTLRFRLGFNSQIWIDIVSSVFPPHSSQIYVRFIGIEIGQ